MKRQDLEKLLGGYSAGTLTPQEEQLLCAAALEDQELFDALAREQPLRDLLQDPVARARLLAALSDQPLPWYRRIAGWAMQPRVLASFAGLFCIVTTLTVWQVKHRREAPVLTAQVAPAAPAAVPAPSFVPETAPAPPPAEPAARRGRMAAPEAKPTLGAEAVGSAQLADNRPAGKEQQPGELKAGAAGAMGGVTETVGQLTAPAVPAVQADRGTLVVPAAPSVQPAPPPPAREIQSLLALAPAPKAAPAGSPLRWTVLRRRPGEEFVAGDATNLQAGDEVKLRVESSLAGYAYVVENQAPLASSHLEPGQLFEAAIAPRGPGRRDLNLWFSAQPMTWPRASVPRPAFFAAGAKAQSPAADSSNKTAVVTPAASSEARTAPPVRNEIPLNYQITLNYQ